MMAKVTIEIDMDDSQETWDALYRRIEAFSDEAATENPPPTPPATYDLLLDPERAFADASDFFAVFTGQD